MEMLLISICLAFLSFSIKINAKHLFQPLSELREVGVGGGRMEKYSADEKLFTQFFLPAASIYRFN